MSNHDSRRPRAVVYGVAGPVLTAEDGAFLRDADPFGFIITKRNAEDPEQLRALIASLREHLGRDDAPILVDQEGGRVARLKPPHWPAHPPMGDIGALAVRDRKAGLEAAWINARLLAHMLRDVGITVDCAPVCDVPIPGADNVIGNRAFCGDPVLVTELARATCRGLLDGGVLPVVKHIPGHGRAFADSHKELPTVDAPRAVLEATDFVPFRGLADAPCGMVAHIVFTALDPERPSSTSPAVIDGLIRGDFGFDGLLFSDDIRMEALDGTLGERAAAVLAGGCDVALHCNGELDEMRSIAERADPMTEAAWARWERARACLLPEPAEIDPVDLRARLDALLGAAPAA